VKRCGVIRSRFVFAKQSGVVLILFNFGSRVNEGIIVFMLEAIIVLDMTLNYPSFN